MFTCSHLSFTVANVLASTLWQLFCVLYRRPLKCSVPPSSVLKSLILFLPNSWSLANKYDLPFQFFTLILEGFFELLELCWSEAYIYVIYFRELGRQAGSGRAFSEQRNMLQIKSMIGFVTIAMWYHSKILYGYCSRYPTFVISHGHWKTHPQYFSFSNPRALELGRREIPLV